MTDFTSRKARSASPSNASHLAVAGAFLAHIEALEQTVNAHSVRLDILRSTLTAFKSGVENRTDRGALLENRYVINLLEALELLVPSEQELDKGVSDAWRQAHQANESAHVAAQAHITGSAHTKRARREAAAGSAA